jgi:glutaredoxin-like protein
MSVLKPSLQRQVREALATLESPVTLAVFTTGDGDALTCEICDDTRQLVEELAWLSDGKVSAEVYDLARDAEVARAHGVDKVPAVVVLGGAAPDKDHGIRFYGIPTGYEFATLIEDIRMVSGGKSGLTAATLDALARLAAPLLIQVYVTPTCPYCPEAVRLAHQMALASDLVTAEMVDASEFPDLADRHHVRGVPRTVINDTVHIEGAVPEAVLVAELTPMLEAHP